MRGKVGDGPTAVSENTVSNTKLVPEENSASFSQPMRFATKTDSPSFSLNSAILAQNPMNCFAKQYV